VDAQGRITFAQNVPIVGLGGTPAGANEEIQFNNNGVFGADANLTWDGVELYANAVETRGLVVSDGRNFPNGGLQLNTSSLSGQTTIYNFYANRPFNILTPATSPITFRNASSGTGDMVRMLPGGAVEIYYNGIKKVETTNTGISVSGTVKAEAGQFQVSNSAQPGFVTGFQAPLAFTQSVVYRLPSADGSAGEVLSTDGAGNLGWISSGTSPNLQAVTTAGNTTTNTINVAGLNATGSSNISAFNGQIYINGSGYFWSGANPAVVSGSSSGAAMDYGPCGFLKMGTASSDFVLVGDYVPTNRRTVEITLGGDLTLRTTAGAPKFSVTGTGDTTIAGVLRAAGIRYPSTDGAVDEVLSTDGAGNLGWITTAKVVAVPGSSGAGGADNEISFDASGNFYFFKGGQWWKVAGVSF
jgi:hypothetical protein